MPVGIIYCNSRGASTEAVADMALYHILSVFRHMTISSLSARSLDPDEFRNAHRQLPYIAHNPRDHTLGIIGLGDIGSAIARKAKMAFGMKITYNDILQKPKDLEAEVDATFYPNREEMLAISDCVLIATPFAGHKLITSALLTHFKPGARLVNIARGSLVDEDALADALESGKLSAVGMDVHADEPRVNERLAKNLNVTMTSHTGGGALETVKGFERLAMENVEAVLGGGDAITPVNLHLIQGFRDGVNGSTGPGQEDRTDGDHMIENHDVVDGEHDIQHNAETLADEGHVNGDRHDGMDGERDVQPVPEDSFDCTDARHDEHMDERIQEPDLDKKIDETGIHAHNHAAGNGGGSNIHIAGDS